MPTLDVALALLKSTIGYDQFRPEQEDIVAVLLAGESVLAVMPTGSGKSMCYRLPALTTKSLSVGCLPGLRRRIALGSFRRQPEGLKRSRSCSAEGKRLDRCG